MLSVDLRKTVSYILVTATSLWPLALPASAQPAAPDLEKALVSIEQALTTIEQRKVVPETVDLDGALEAYLDAAFKEFEGARAAVGADIKARLAAGHGITKLEAFERTAQAHRRRVDRVVTRLSVVNGQIRTGSIRLSRELVRKLGKEEVEEFKTMLAPDVRKQYEAIDPRFGGADAVSALRPDEKEPCGQPCVVAQAKGLLGQVKAVRPQSSLLERLDGLVMPPVEAAMGLGCVGACATLTAAGCAVCIVAAGTTAALLYETAKKSFLECNNIRSRLLRAACKVAIVAAVLAAIA